MTKLELHRENFIANRRTGPLMRIEDLSSGDYELLNRDFLAAAKGVEMSLESIYEIYLQVLTAWGVICPHPLAYRRFNDKGSPWYACSLCKTTVLNQ